MANFTPLAADKPASEVPKEKLRSFTPLEEDAPAQQGKSYDAGDYIGGALAGFNQGVLNILGAPVDISNAISGFVGLGMDNPPGGSRSLRSITPDALFPETPDDSLGRGLNRVGQELGANALPTVALLSKAKKVSDAVKAGVRPAKNTTERFLAPIAKNPAGFAAAETAASAGSGIGAAVAQEVAPGNPWAEMAGQAIGSLGPTALTIGPASVVARTARKAVKRFSPSGQAKAGADAAKRIVGSEMTPGAERALDEADRLRERAPGFNPSLGESTGSPSLLAQQRELEKRASGAQLEDLAARRAGSEAGIETYRQAQAPKGESNPDIIFDHASNELYIRRENIADETAAVRRDREDLAGQVPKGDLRAEGATMRGSVETARSETRERLHDLSRQLGVRDTRVPFEATRDAMVGTVNRIANVGDPKRYQSSPAGIPNTLKRARAKKGSWTLGEIVKLREDIGKELRATRPLAAQGKEGADARVRGLIAMRGEIDGFLDDLATAPQDLASNPNAASFAENYRAWRDAYFRDFVEVFEKPLTKEVRKVDGASFYKTSDEKTAQAFFKPEKQGGTSAAQEYKAMVRGDPDALAAMEAVALDSLHTAAVRDGVIDPKLFQHWMTRHGEPLKAFPEIRQRVMDIRKANVELKAREAELGTRAAELEKMRLTKSLDRYKGGVTPADEALRKALANPREMAELFAYVRHDKDTLAALRRSIWDEVTQGTAGDTLAALDRYGPSLKHLFHPGHFEAIIDVIEMRAMMERSVPPMGAAVQARPLAALEEKIGQGIPQLGSRYFAFQSGRMQKGYLIADTVMRGLRGREQAALERAMTSALYDPAVARHMRAAMDADKMADLAKGTKLDRLAMRILRHGGPAMLRMLAAQTGEAGEGSRQ